MPTLIDVSPWANVRIGGENMVEPASAAPAFTIVRRVKWIFITFPPYVSCIRVLPLANGELKPSLARVRLREVESTDRRPPDHDDPRELQSGGNLRFQRRGIIGRAH